MVVIRGISKRRCPVSDSNETDIKKARALEVREQLQLLTASRVEQVFARGQLLLECERDGLYSLLGYAHQEDFIRALGLKRATAFSDKQIARVFDRTLHGQLGIGRLRLLAADCVPDPLSIVANGIEIERAPGQAERVPLEQVSYRELRRALARYKRTSAKIADTAGEQAALQHAAEALLGRPPARLPAPQSVLNVLAHITPKASKISSAPRVPLKG